MFLVSKYVLVSVRTVIYSHFSSSFTAPTTTDNNNRVNHVFTVYTCRGEYFEYVDAQKLPTVKQRKWDSWDFGYDNVLAAMLTLFAVQTGEGWPA